MLPSLVSSAKSMTGSEDNTGDDMTKMMIIINDTAANNNTSGMTMSDSSPEASISMPGDSAVSRGANNESDRIASDINGKPGTILIMTTIVMHIVEWIWNSAA